MSTPFLDDDDDERDWSHRIYADWNAETRESYASRRTRVELENTRHLGNPSSSHAEGRAAKALLERARTMIESECGARSGSLIFTSGATESNHLAIVAGMKAAGERRTRVVTTPFEHASVSRVVAAYDPMFLRVSRETGAVDLDNLVELASEPDVGMVSVILAHNEFGTIQSVSGIREAMRRVRRDRETGLLSVSHFDTAPMLHYDATQLFGKAEFSVVDSEADFVSWSAHKFRGPGGVGGLFFDERSDLATYPECCSASGSEGGQEMGLRAGTENVIGVACAAAALAFENDAGRRLGVWDQIRIRATSIAAGLRSERSVVVNAAPDSPVPSGGFGRLCNTIHLSFRNMTGVEAARLLDAGSATRPGIAVSTGSACSRSHPSAALKAIGFDETLVRGAIRVSIGSTTTDADADEIRRALVEIARTDGF